MLDYDILNGDSLKIVDELELYVADEAYIVHVPTNMKCGKNIGDNVFEPERNDRADILDFFVLNTYNLLTLFPKMEQKTVKDVVLLRYYCIKYGLINPGYSVDEHHVKYNQAIRSDITKEMGDIRDTKRGFNIFTKEDEKLINYWNLNFYNFTCLLAYMFRVRGHHFVPGMDNKYEHLWAKINRNYNIGELNFETLMTVGLHAIIPDVLDDWYTHCVKNNKVSEILKLRYSAKAAGTAIISVLHAGISDLKVSFPGVVKNCEEEVDYVQKVYEAIDINRWKYSQNAPFYGHARERIDENKLNSLASMIFGTVTGLVPNHPMVKSMALQRVAGQAPITGSALARAILTYIDSPAYANHLDL